MSLFSGRIVLLLVVIIASLGFGTGNLHWDSDKTKCFMPKSWTQEDWHTLYALGRLELRYHPKNYDCDPAWKLDPKVWTSQDGILRRQ